MSTVTPAGANSAAIAPGAATGTLGGDRAKLSTACQQFEAIFVRQMLASARKASFGDELFGSSAVDTFREMQDNHFADVIAQSGSLGLAAQIEAQVTRFLPPETGGKG